MDLLKQLHIEFGEIQPFRLSWNGCIFVGFTYNRVKLYDYLNSLGLYPQNIAYLSTLIESIDDIDTECKHTLHREMCESLLYFPVKYIDKLSAILFKKFPFPEYSGIFHDSNVIAAYKDFLSVVPEYQNYLTLKVSNWSRALDKNAYFDKWEGILGTKYTIDEMVEQNRNSSEVIPIAREVARYNLASIIRPEIRKQVDDHFKEAVQERLAFEQSGVAGMTKEERFMQQLSDEETVIERDDTVVPTEGIAPSNEGIKYKKVKIRRNNNVSLNLFDAPRSMFVDFMNNVLTGSSETIKAGEKAASGGSRNKASFDAPVASRDDIRKFISGK